MASRPRAGSIEEKVAELNELIEKTPRDQVAAYEYRLDVSWIHHDSALEGIVYEPHELAAAIDEQVVSDSSLMPVYDEIRQFKAAIDHARALAKRGTLEVTLDTMRDLYQFLAPDEENKGPPRYRKDIPLHRLYFHEIAPPDKIAPRMRQLLTWLGDTDARRHMHPIRAASKAHHKLLLIFPFPKHSGKVARLMMNAMLMHAGYPPAILHSTDRQGYYEALRQGSNEVSRVVQDALENAVNSGLRYFYNLHGISQTIP